MICMLKNSKIFFHSNTATMTSDNRKTIVKNSSEVKDYKGPRISNESFANYRAAGSLLIDFLVAAISFACLHVRFTYYNGLSNKNRNIKYLCHQFDADAQRLFVRHVQEECTRECSVFPFTHRSIPRVPLEGVLSRWQKGRKSSELRVSFLIYNHRSCQPSPLLRRSSSGTCQPVVLVRLVKIFTDFISACNEDKSRHLPATENDVCSKPATNAFECFGGCVFQGRPNEVEVHFFNLMYEFNRVSDNLAYSICCVHQSYGSVLNQGGTMFSIKCFVDCQPVSI